MINLDIVAKLLMLSSEGEDVGENSIRRSLFALEESLCRKKTIQFKIKKQLIGILRVKTTTIIRSMKHFAR